MRTLYIECDAGASGDMIFGALADLPEIGDRFETVIGPLKLPGVEIRKEKGESRRISGTKLRVSVDGIEEGDGKHHGHRHLSDVLGIINGLCVSEKVKKDSSEIYSIIAEAESRVHGVPVDLVHFHEVGALDAVADIVGTCLLMEELNPERILVSPIRTGYGHIGCAHGTLPVPAPATARILEGMPVYAGNEEGEFCTPTGAAILKHFADGFSRMPAMVLENTGYGIGSREFETPNILRTYLGNTENGVLSIREITCNIDDMNPEDLGNIADVLLGSGALDAFIKPCIMKKGRPGFELTCLCREEHFDNLAHMILSRTSTRGLRVHGCDRYAMSCRFDKTDTEYGEIRIKVSEGFGLRKWKPEYDDLSAAAEKHNVTVGEVRSSIRYDPDAKNDDNRPGAGEGIRTLEPLRTGS